MQAYLFADRRAILSFFCLLLIGLGLAIASPTRAAASTTTLSPTFQRTWGVESASWTTAHDSTDGVYTYSGNIGYVITRYGNSSIYAVYRDFEVFDTSGVGEDMVVTSGTYAFYVSDFLFDDSREYALYAVSGDQSTVATSSFSGCGTTALSDTFSSDDMVDDSYHSVTLNAAGLAYISTTGTTQFCMRDATKDVPDIAPPGPGNQSHIMIDGYTGSNPPKLTLEFEYGF